MAKKPRQRRDVIEAVEKMAGASFALRSKEYRAGLEPMIGRILRAKSVKGLKKTMSAALAAGLSVAPVGESLGQAMLHADLIGRVAATPRQPATKTQAHSVSLLQQADFSPKTFDKAAERLRKKAALTSDQFDRLQVKYRSLAFRIAKVNNAGAVQHVRDVITRGIRDGRTFAQIRDELLRIFDVKGIPRPFLSRLRFAFEEQTRQAYSDARDETLDDDEMAATFPFWQYRTLGDRRVRPEHAALDGKVFRVSDGSVARFRPPWDFNCRCQRMPLTAGEVRRGRMTVWTRRGGAIAVAAGPKKKPIKMRANPKYDRTRKKISLGSLDADLRKLLEA